VTLGLTFSIAAMSVAMKAWEFFFFRVPQKLCSVWRQSACCSSEQHVETQYMWATGGFS